MNTVTEMMLEDDRETLTPMTLEVSSERIEHVVGTWLMAVTSRFSGCTISRTTRPGGGTVHWFVTFDGRTVSALVVTGPDTRWL